MHILARLPFLSALALSTSLAAAVVVPYHNVNDQVPSPPAHLLDSQRSSSDAPGAPKMDKRQGMPGRQPGLVGSDGTGFGIGGGQGHAYKQSAQEQEQEQAGQVHGDGAPEGGAVGGSSADDPAANGAETSVGAILGGTGTMSGETVVEIATQDLDTISRLIVAPSTTPLPTNTDPTGGATITRMRPNPDPTSFGPTTPVLVSTYVDPNATSTSAPTQGVQGTVSNAGAGLSATTSSSAAGPRFGIGAGGSGERKAVIGWVAVATGAVVWGTMLGAGLRSVL